MLIATFYLFCENSNPFLYLLTYIFKQLSPTAIKSKPNNCLYQILTSTHLLIILIGHSCNRTNTTTTTTTTYPLNPIMTSCCFSIFGQVMPIVKRGVHDPQVIMPEFWSNCFMWSFSKLRIQDLFRQSAVLKSVQFASPSQVALGQYIVHARELKFLQGEFICNMLLPLDI